MSERQIAIVIEWIVKPVLVATVVLVLGGLFLATFSQQYSFASLWAVIDKKFSADYEHKLSPPLLAQLRGGGFTLFIRHASRDGVDVQASTALDRAYLIDPTLVPADFRWGLCLNDFGRVESHLLGKFLKGARIPVGEVLASPLCRARETAELSVGRIDKIEPSLVIDAAVASAGERAARASRLKHLLDQRPPLGTNRLLFSHGGVLETQGYERIGLEQAGMVVLQRTGEGLKIRAIVTLREMLNALPSTLPAQP